MKLRRRQLLLASASAATATLAGPALSQTTGEPNKPYGLSISARFPFGKRNLPLLGSSMAYVDEGEGPVVLFLHGNPTSSYLWRNIIPHVVAGGYRAIAPDLIGMGDSGKPDIGYTFGEHADYLDGFIGALELTDITLVVHDWGSALGMRHARLNPDNVRAMAFMEAIIPPVFPAASFDAMGPAGPIFKAIRTAGIGEDMILNKNFFVEEMLHKTGVARGLTSEEMAFYRAPFPTPDSRRPTLQWPREIPIGGVPKATHDAITANGAWLTQSDIPKLLFYASPGAILPAPAVGWVIANVPNLESRFVGAGRHFLQEDHPDLIGTGIADWLRRL